ncbi:HAD family hydrolase [Bauldia sp.]|uniref:HAD family hydrolase n=1 Tax=Bauldia sp. TaxID=2575872 RepID=UPI003BACA8C9
MAPTAPSLTTIGFDADDTLWEHETFYRMTEERFRDLLGDHADGEDVLARLLAAERRNLAHYGFGVKAFTLSMIETAIEVTDGRVPAPVIGQILEAGREMLSHPIETLPGARETIEAVTADYRVVLITKGDLFDQERKLAQSRLGDLFDGVEIVSDKTVDTYRRVFTDYGDGPQRAMMVGNSLRSDVLPAIEAGSWGVYVPHDLTWAIERAEPPADLPRFRRIDSLRELEGVIREIDGG